MIRGNYETKTGSKVVRPAGEKTLVLCLDRIISHSGSVSLLYHCIRQPTGSTNQLPVSRNGSSLTTPLLPLLLVVLTKP